MPTKHALIVGVDKYCNIDKKYELSGCVNDANALMSHERFLFNAILPVMHICATKSR